MKILVCFKQVPERNQNFKVAGDGKSIQWDGLTLVENDFDRYSVEAALKLKEKNSGEVTVLTVGKASALDALRKALAMGADRGIHIESDAQADPFLISQMIAKAVKDDNFDLVFAGVQSEDQAYSQTGPMVAHLLGLPHITTAVDIEIPGEGKLQVKRELEGGALEKVVLPLPALVTIQTGMNTPRYPTLPNIMKAKRKEVRKVSPEDLGFSATTLLSGRASEVLELSHPPKKEGGEILQGSVDEMADKLVKIFKEEIKVL